MINNPVSYESSSARNEFVLDNVLDTLGYRDETPCPSCGQSAERRDYDECLGGSINQVHSIDCSHCGYHECSQEFCPSCECEFSRHSEALVVIEHVELMLDYLVDTLTRKPFVKATEVTTLKLKLVLNADADRLLSDILLVPRGGRTVHYIQRKLLDAKFTRNLELKILQAKERSFEIG
ncbi:hypothetical protein [Vibrio rotiferianus]|uniref:hypothetical protein n=1 Tax=Vibrio rotiferianus TaxID=190895 RepID=UPI0005EF19A1|nr:hypothetical protein [Vibrio rotiferianus]